MTKSITHNYHSEEFDHSHSGKITIVLFFIGLFTFIIALFLPKGFIQNILFTITFISSGYHIIIEGFVDTYKETIHRKKFTPNVHILMTIAAIGAMIINEFREASLLILIFAGAHYLEDYAQNRSKQEISSLLKLHPTSARKIMPSGEIKTVDVSELKVGDRISILNGDQIPTDGIVLSGTSSVDQSAITGESIPVDKQAGDELFGSTINGMGTLIMEVTKESSETVFAKIIQLVKQTQLNFSKTATFIKKLEPIYVTAVIILAPIFYMIGLYFFQWDMYDSFYRTMVFLIAASPCALAVTDIPATLSAISHLAKQGVLFKGGSYLSQLADISAVAFDKTGTLTTGKPVVTNTYFSKDIEQKQITTYEKIIVSMEKKSNHPLAEAILEYYDKIEPIELDVENQIGIGLIATVNKKTFKLGKPNASFSIPKDIQAKTNKLEHEGKTVVHFSFDNQVVGLIAIQDLPKSSSRDAIQYFQQEHIHTVMLTGDSKKTGEAVGQDLAIDEIQGNILPEEKADIITDLKKKYSTIAMLGDGVNDSPALVTADIGVAMGEGTDIAVDVADAVLMKNDLTKFAYAHKLAKKLRKIVWQNIYFAISIVLLLIVMNITGSMNMAFAVIIHEGSTLAVILNGLRLLNGTKS